MREMPEGFGGNFGATVIDPISLVVLAICVGLVFAGKRPMVVIATLAIASILPQSLRIVVASMDFSMIRIIVLMGLARLLLKGEMSSLKVSVHEYLLILFLLLKTIIPTVLNGSFAIFIREFAASVDVLGVYLISRCCIRKYDDLYQIIFVVAVVVCICAPLYYYEFKTQFNVFSIFAGVDSAAWVRDGEVRARGSMPHAILAGCYWATFLPFYLCILLRKNSTKPLFILAAIATVLIALSSSSSTPMFSVLSAFGAVTLYYVRGYMTWIRRGTVMVLVILHFSMSMPVWHLISRFSFSASSTGRFRYMLIDSFINNWNEWFLIGQKHTGHWFFGAQDITNEFVLVGVKGGIVTLSIFIAQIFFAYRAIGQMMERRNQVQSDLLIIWALGASLFVHITNFIGVSYFGQISVLWYFVLGSIVALQVATNREPTEASHSHEHSVFGKKKYNFVCT